MEETLKAIDATIFALKQNLVDFHKGDGKFNKAAGVRARKLSLDLEKLMKQFRKESVKV